MTYELINVIYYNSITIRTTSFVIASRDYNLFISVKRAMHKMSRASEKKLVNFQRNIENLDLYPLSMMNGHISASYAINARQVHQCSQVVLCCI